MPRRLLRYLPLLAALALLFAWPLIVLVAGAFRSAPPGSSGAWTLEAVRTVLAMPGLGGSLLNSFVLAGATSALALPLAAVLAFVAEKTDAPLRRLITPAVLLVFATPGLFYAISFCLMANPYTGVLNGWISRVFSVATPWLTVESWGGLVGVSVLKAGAFLYLFLLAQFKMLNAGQEDASLVSGAGRLETFARIQLPALTPALTSGLIFSMAGGLQSFDLVMVLGGGQNIGVLSTAIYELLNAKTPPDYAAANLVSLALVAIVAALAVLQWRLVGGRSFVGIGGKSEPQRRIRLRAVPRAALGLATAAYLLVAVVLPFASLLYASVQPYPGVQGEPTWNQYRRVVAQADIAVAAATTVWLGLGVGIAAVALAAWVNQAESGMGRRLRAVTRAMVLIPVAMPGVVSAVAFTWAYVAIPGLRGLYGTAWLMGIALIVSLLPLGNHIIRAATAKVGPELAEAARIAGSGATGAYLRIVLPLIAPTLLVAWYFCFLIVAGSLEIPLLMGRSGMKTLAVQIYSFNNQGQLGSTAALIVLMLASLAATGTAGLAGMFLFRWLRHRRRAHAAPLRQSRARRRWVAAAAPGGLQQPGEGRPMSAARPPEGARTAARSTEVVL
jgi:iron(III) transport system permease protein